jgi:FkbM family methyltransferase
MGTSFRNIEHEIIYNKLVDHLKETKTSNVQAPKGTDEEAGNYNNKFREIDLYLRIMQDKRENHAYRYLHSHRKWIGSAIVFAKKVVRKLLKWYIEPVTIQQTEFNNAVTPSVGRITELVRIVTNKLETVEHEIIKKQVILENLNQQVMKQQELLGQIEDSKIRHDNLVEELNNRFNLKYDMLVDEMNNKFSLMQEKSEVIENKVEIFEPYIQKIDEVLDLTSEMKTIEMKFDQSFYNKKTYAQSGEDSIVSYILNVLGLQVSDTMYIDLGANHAKELSNTYYLYQKGARGILVEANPSLIPELRLFRNRDIILNKCISTETQQSLTFYVLSGDGLSTSSLATAEEYCHLNNNIEIVETIEVESITYHEIIDKFLGKAPTLLSVDIEGIDFDIIKSIDFSSHRPLIIILEMIEYKTELNHASKNIDLKNYLELNGYEEYAFTGINSIFLDSGYKNR